MEADTPNPPVFSSRLAFCLGAWVGIAIRFAPWVLVAALVSAGWGLFYASSSLGVNTATRDMFSQALTWRKYQEADLRAFPQYGNTILVVLEGPVEELVEERQARLVERLSRESGPIDWAYAPGASPFFRQQGLLYLSLDELDAFADRLTRAQPVLGRLSADPTLRGVARLLRDISSRDGTKAGLAPEPLYRAMAQAGEAALDGLTAPLSWARLGRIEPSGVSGEDGAVQRFVIVRPRLDFHQLLPAAQAMARIRDIATEMELAAPAGIRTRLSGASALAHEELVSVTAGAQGAGLGAFIGVALILAWGLRSMRLVAAALLSLVIGLAWTVFFAAYAVGHLNLISVAFAVLYIGLGIDYAIHYCLRVRELVAQGTPGQLALRYAAGDVGGSLVICTVTTGVGFFAFVPSDFSGVSELGLISGTGMFISLFASLTVLPALLTVLPLKTVKPFTEVGSIPGSTLGSTLGSTRGSTLGSTRGSTRGSTANGPQRTLPGSIPWERRWRWPVLMATLCALVGSVVVATKIEFDANPLNLRDPASESVATYVELLRDRGRAPWTGVVLTDSLEAAAQLAGQARALDVVETVRYLADLVPNEQDEKLLVIADLDLVLGPVLQSPADVVNPTLDEVRRELSGAYRALARGPEGGDVNSERARLSKVLERLSGALEATLELFAVNALRTLPLQLSRLESLLSARAVSGDSLPAQLRARWVSPDGQYRVQIEPAQDLNKKVALAQFVTHVRRIAPAMTGVPVVNYEAGEAMVSAFRTALTIAFVFIAIVLTVTLGGWRDAVTVLSLVVIGAIFATSALVLCGLSFNFANIIALPLMLGIGVDNGVHMLHRMRVVAPARGGFLATSTARAVLASALTTIVGFGNLAFTQHRGMSSMGVLLSLGLGFSLLCTLVVLPVLYQWWLQREEQTL